jgi:hypothetical protein
LQGTPAARPLEFQAEYAVVRKLEKVDAAAVNLE